MTREDDENYIKEFDFSKWNDDEVAEFKKKLETKYMAWIFRHATPVFFFICYVILPMASITFQAWIAFEQTGGTKNDGEWSWLIFAIGMSAMVGPITGFVTQYFLNKIPKELRSQFAESFEKSQEMRDEIDANGKAESQRFIEETNKRKEAERKKKEEEQAILDAFYAKQKEEQT